MPRPHLRSLTATTGDGLPAMPSNVTVTEPEGPVTVSNNYFSDSDDWSTVTPGPIVELTETFCR